MPLITIFEKRCCLDISSVVASIPTGYSLNPPPPTHLPPHPHLTSSPRPDSTGTFPLHHRTIHYFLQHRNYILITKNHPESSDQTEKIRDKEHNDKFLIIDLLQLEQSKQETSEGGMVGVERTIKKSSS